MHVKNHPKDKIKDPLKRKRSKLKIFKKKIKNHDQAVAQMTGIYWDLKREKSQ